MSSSLHFRRTALLGLTPNRSLNRTQHSVPVFVPAKTLAQIPSRCSMPVSFDVKPHNHTRLMHLFESHPLLLFSGYTQVQSQILETQRLRVLNELDRAFPDGSSVYGPDLNDAFGDFWMWSLAAYEVIRTMAQNRHCFSQQYGERLVAMKRQIAVYRMPLAKQELKGKPKSAVLSEAYISTMDVARRDFALQVESKLYWAKEEMKAVSDLLHSVTIDDVCHPITNGRAPWQSAA